MFSQNQRFSEQERTQIRMQYIMQVGAYKELFKQVGHLPGASAYTLNGFPELIDFQEISTKSLEIQTAIDTLNALKKTDADQKAVLEEQRIQQARETAELLKQAAEKEKKLASLLYQQRCYKQYCKEADAPIDQTLLATPTDISDVNALIEVLKARNRPQAIAAGCAHPMESCLLRVLDSCTKPNSDLKNALLQHPDFHMNQETFMDFYPISNESGHFDILTHLNQVQLLKNPDKKHAVLVFGEASFLSMLPEWEQSLRTDVVILADIDHRLHEHTRFMLDTLLTSDSIDEFLGKYSIHNAVIDYYLTTPSSCGSVFFRVLPQEQRLERLTQRLLSRQQDDLKELFFASSEERFHACKRAAQALEFVHIRLDLFDTRHCQDLSRILMDHHYQLVFCNFSNIGAYERDAGRGANLMDSMEILFQAGDESHFAWAILCATGNLYSQLYTDKKQLLETMPRLGYRKPNIPWSISSEQSIRFTR